MAAHLSFIVGIVGKELDLHTRLCFSNKHILEGGEEQIHAELRVAPVRDDSAGDVLVDLLRTPEDRRPAHRHRQRSRQRHAIRLRRAFPRLLSQGYEGEDAETGGSAERGLVRGGGSGDLFRLARPRSPPRDRVHVRRPHRRHVRSAHGCHEAGGAVEERGVHAILALILPLPQRWGVERLLCACQGLLHWGSERHRVHLGHSPTDPICHIQEKEASEKGGRSGGCRH
ncbi:bidirectional sugar transporter SWEET16-like isoform X1 [Iris pallida]|uniref:Bidirectional sugar transporter SWEET16-like isoform X1 n=1 Tax=Iris pallida TaxID=29817 RepID=A0AAX6F8N7_IRIPA|nr:bidirectional sugar transporter SWEET16-like isoform X1 [Iris pallida]